MFPLFRWMTQLFRHGTDSDLVIRRFLDLSTVHLSEETRADLNTHRGVTAHKTEYGWIMYAPQDPGGLVETVDWPEELLPIMTLARANGCAYIFFDRDAEETSLLPVFDA